MKKVWNTPKLANHGNVETITAGTIELKKRGGGDDLASTISNA